MDYTDRIIGIAKIRVKDGLKWIGQTGLLSVQSLFPPPYYDTGYANLLNEYKKPSNNQINTVDYIKLFGSIQTSLDKGTQRKTTENELPSLTQCTA